MYLDQYSPIKISKPLWHNDIHTTQDRRKILQFFIFMELELFFLLFCDHQDTGSKSCKLGNCVSGPTFNFLKHQRVYGTYISILHRMGAKYFGNYKYMSAGPTFKFWNIKGSMGHVYIHTTSYGSKIFWQLFIVIGV